MKKLLLLIFLCTLSVNLFAQSHEASFKLNDSTMLTLPHADLFKLSGSTPFRSLRMPVDTGFFKHKRVFAVHHEPMMTYPRIVLLRPPRIVVHQKYVKYGSQIIFLEPPKIIIYPAQIVYE